MTTFLDRFRVRWIMLALLVALPALTGSGYVANLGILALLFVMLAVSYNVLVGLSGYLSLAHAAMFGLGAYSAGLLAAVAGDATFWVALPAGVIVAGGVSLLFGSAVLQRVRGFSFSIVTLGAGVTLWVVASHWVDVTRGPLGIPGLTRPALGGLELTTPLAYFYLGVPLACVALAVTRLVDLSDGGRVLRAIRDNERLTATLGIDTYRFKLGAFVLSGALAGAAGVYYAHYVGVVSPEVFWLYWITTPLVIVMIGGMGHHWAVVASAIGLAVVPQLLRIGAEHQQLLFGILLLATVVLLPNGVGGRLSRVGDT